MSKKIKTIMVEQENVVAFECDCCGKEMPLNYPMIDYEESTNHWGNDSYESLTFYNFCSVECLINFLLEKSDKGFEEIKIDFCKENNKKEFLQYLSQAKQKERYNDNQ